MRTQLPSMAVLVASLIAHAACAGETLKILVPGGSVEGTLEWPDGDGACPVALIIAGSGPTDRDGNNPLAGRNNSLKYLAEALASKGIASFRYDKRGIGASAGAMGAEEQLRFETYIDDAVACAETLRKNPRLSRLVVIGHSEGALIGAVACRKAGADGFVSIAGSGTPAPRLLREQLKDKLPADLRGQAEAIIRSLEQGKLTQDVPPALFVLFRPSVQPYLISWFRYDPVKELAMLWVPVLIVQGTEDLQVAVDQSYKLARANPNAKHVLIRGMNHVLKMASGNLAQQAASYSDPNLPIAGELVDQIVAFIESLSSAHKTDSDGD